MQYEYHLGDKVYIGASEYEILSVDDERVMLLSLIHISLATKLTDVINETMTDPMVGILHHEEGVDLVPAVH